jgi:RNA polymerase sigma-70 factor (ECF subfamily)
LTPEAALTAETTREARFEAFVAEHRERAVNLAWRLLGDHSTAEDVAQQAFIRAWRGLDGFRDESKLSTWFHSILVRQARSHQRWAGVRRSLGLLSLDGETPTAPVEPAGPDAGLRRRIGAAIETLSPHQREAFVCMHLHGLSVQETAEVLGRAPGTVKSHLHRALVKLRHELDDLREESA